MKSTTKLSIFLASPSDVTVERTIVREVVDELNRNLGSSHSFHVEVIGWDSDARPAYGDRPQALINTQIGDMSQYDAFVGIMWNRFGTPTGSFGSGTEEEFHLAVKSNSENNVPEIMLYFSSIPSTLANRDATTQRLNVLAFKEQLDKALFWEYSTRDEFRTLVTRHLTQWIVEKTRTTPKPTYEAPLGSDQAIGERLIIPTPVLDWVMLGSSFHSVIEARESGKSIELVIDASETGSDELLRSLAQRQAEVPFAHGNQAGMLKIISGEKATIGGKSNWKIAGTLVDSSSRYTEMTFNGVTPDELAMMKARLIMLSEKPTFSDPFMHAFMFRDVLPGAEVDGPSVLQRLYSSLGIRTAHFPAYARLMLLFHLKTLGIIANVVELKVGPVSMGSSHVTLVGFRPRIYTNREPLRIEISGDCPISD